MDSISSNALPLQQFYKLFVFDYQHKPNSSVHITGISLHFTMMNCNSLDYYLQTLTFCQHQLIV
jgi:hypothetical protein